MLQKQNLILASLKQSTTRHKSYRKTKMTKIKDGGNRKREDNEFRETKCNAGFLCNRAVS